jgi:hypothetical protein
MFKAIVIHGRTVLVSDSYEGVERYIQNTTSEERIAYRPTSETFFTEDLLESPEEYPDTLFRGRLILRGYKVPMGTGVLNGGYKYHGYRYPDVIILGGRK